jgi:hypothetical protein
MKAITIGKHSFQLKHLLSAIGIILLLGIGGAWWLRPHISPSFYVWKTSFHLSASERSLLASQEVDELFVRFFDVDWDGATQQPLPVANIHISDSTIRNFKVIPVVFITNKVFLNIMPDGIRELVQKMHQTIVAMANKHHLQISEIQIDCDWTEKSRTAYFQFLQLFNERIDHQNIPLSATIRLHQIKYFKRTGIPPVDRGMLMFYNMGNMNDTLGNNSIFNTRDASQYVSSINDYPLDLDVALPIFSWVVQSRQNRIVALMSNTYAHELAQLTGVTSTKPLYFRVDTPQFFRGEYFRKGDCLKVESVSPSLALEAADLLSHHLTKRSRRVVMFRLDSLTISQYEEKDIQAIMDCFR